MNDRKKALVMEYSEVQKIAKDTIDYIKSKITAGMKLTDIRKLCENKMLASSWLSSSFFPIFTLSSIGLEAFKKEPRSAFKFERIVPAMSSIEKLPVVSPSENFCQKPSR